MSDISIRQAHAGDHQAIFRVFVKSIHDLGHRAGYEEEQAIDDEVISRTWPQWQSIYNHLTTTHHMRESSS